MFRLESFGTQQQLIINTAHPFYTKVYSRNPAPTWDEIREIFELLLFLIGKAELDGDLDKKDVYRDHREQFSKSFADALDSLRPDAMHTDEQAAKAEKDLGSDS